MANQSGSACYKAERCGFTILHWNAGGLSWSKFSELGKIAEEERADVLVILEANITEEKMKYFQLKGYTFHGLFKQRQVASGILVGIKDSLTAKFAIVKEMNTVDKAEIIKVNILINKKKFLIYGIYSPPNNKNLNLDILPVPKNTILVGDFNAASPSWGYETYNQVGKLVEDFSDSNALTVLYNKDDPKSFIHYSGSSTNPDLTIVAANIQDNCKKKVIGDPGSGHRIIKTTYENFQSKKYEATRTSWNFKKANWKTFNSSLEERITNFPNELSPQEETGIFAKAILQSAKLSIPRGKVPKYKPFWNEDLEIIRKNRDRAREKAEQLHGKTEEEKRRDVIQWRRDCAVMKREIIKAKRKSWNDFLENLDYRKDSPKAHRLIDSLNNKRKSTTTHTIRIGNTEISEEKEIAKKFNEHFLGKFKLDKKKKKMESKFKRLLSRAPEYPDELGLFNVEFTTEELNNAINDLQNKKQPGPDEIFPELLIHMGKKARLFLLSVYNKFWTSSYSLPADWVKAKIIPIQKPNKPSEDINSYRPISLTSVLAKTMERMISCRLSFFLESNEIINEEQAGFRKNMSTANAILKLVHGIKTGFNSKKSSLAVFVDFQGAYDSVWRSKLLVKLLQSGISGRMLSWYRRFLTQRWCRTSWKNIDSSYRQSRIGLPQGAVSSCVLFNLYTNDLIEKLKKIEGVNVCMFADDMVIWIQKENIKNFQKQQDYLETTMNSVLKYLSTWCEENNMTINKSKTVYQFFSMKHINPAFRIEVGGTLLNKSTTTKYLGVMLDNKLSFKNHVNHIKDKVEERSKILKRLAGAKWGCTQDTLNKTYNTYIKPVIKYGSEMLIHTSQENMNVLERAQNKVLRIITGAVKTTPIEALQLYTNNNSIFYEIMKHSVGVHVKMKCSNRAKWMHTYKKSSMKTQISPIETCDRILEELDVSVSNTLFDGLTNPLNFMEIEHHLPDVNYGKKETPCAFLKALSLCTINENFPSSQWTKIYTDGSQIGSTSGAGVYCDLFSRSAPVGSYMSNYDAEIAAIDLALTELTDHKDSFSKAVILVDSSSAIQGVTGNQSKESPTISRIRSNIRTLFSWNKVIVFQWVPSHVGIEGNENADALAKIGTDLPQENLPIPTETLKKVAQRKVQKLQNDIHVDRSRGKAWEDIQNDWPKFCQKPRKEAVAAFRIKTGHDWLAEQLQRLGFLNSKDCHICGEGTLNAAHLISCKGLNKDAQLRGDLCHLYWEARTHLFELQHNVPA